MSIEFELVTRVETLEKQNRRLKLAGSVCLLLVTAAFLLAQDRKMGPIIEAEQFIVTNKQGNACAALGLMKDATPALQLLDNKHKPRALLSLDKDGLPSLNLIGENDEARATLSLILDDLPSLIFHDKEGKIRAMFQMFKSGLAGLGFLDEKRSRMWVDLTKLEFMDANGTVLFKTP